MSMNWIFRMWQELRARQIGNMPLGAVVVLVLVMMSAGGALDFGMSYQARQKLDVAAQSAADCRRSTKPGIAGHFSGCAA